MRDEAAEGERKRGNERREGEADGGKGKLVHCVVCGIHNKERPYAGWTPLEPTTNIKPKAKRGDGDTVAGNINYGPG